MTISARASRAKAAVDNVTTFFGRIQAVTDPDVLDFTFGNPHELALPGLSAALRSHAVPGRSTGSPTRPASLRHRRSWPPR